MPLRIDQILLAIKAALEAFLAKSLAGGGEVSVALDAFNVFELLGANTRGYRLILHWAGDQNISEVEPIPLLYHKIEVIFGSPLGLTVRPDMALIQATAGRPPLYQSIDDLRTLLLTLQFASPQAAGLMEYRGCEPVITPEGLPLAAYKLTFGLRAVPSQSPNPINI